MGKFPDWTGNVPRFDIAAMFNAMEQFEVQANTLPAGLVPLDREPRTNLPTSEAAQHLNRRPQTLRIWACMECGPLRPTRIHGRLAWPVAAIRALLQVPSSAGNQPTGAA